MFWFISFIISVLILGTLLFFSHPQERVRDSVLTYWKKYQWVDLGSRRVPIPIWMVFVAILISIIPVINIILSIVIIAKYYIQYKGHEDNNSNDLVDHRLVLRAPYLRWVKWLNKTI